MISTVVVLPVLFVSLFSCLFMFACLRAVAHMLVCAFLLFIKYMYIAGVGFFSFCFLLCFLFSYYQISSIVFCCLFLCCLFCRAVFYVASFLLLTMLVLVCFRALRHIFCALCCLFCVVVFFVFSVFPLFLFCFPPSPPPHTCHNYTMLGQ